MSTQPLRAVLEEAGVEVHATLFDFAIRKVENTPANLGKSAELALAQVLCKHLRREATMSSAEQRVSGVVDTSTSITMRSAEVRGPTVGGFITALSLFPPEYRLDFSPGECEDVTTAAEIAVLEGTTSDGPGTVWIQLKDDGR